MKKHFDGILVVEGKTDVALLSNYIDTEFVITNGSDISKQTLTYLQSRCSDTRIVVLTDPDTPGKRIRDIIEQNVNNVSHCFIEKKHAIKHNKVGVAECDVEHLLNSLENVLTFTIPSQNTLTMSDLYGLNIVGGDSESNKNKICEHYHLGYVNSKTLLKRLNGLSIKKEELIKLL